MVSEDLAADPFSERTSRLRTERLHVLGGAFQFESDSPRLLRIARHAYADLPRHRLSAPTPDFRVRLVLRSGRDRSRASEPAPVQMLSGAGLLYGARGSSE